MRRPVEPITNGPVLSKRGERVPRNVWIRAFTNETDQKRNKRRTEEIRTFLP